MRFVMEFRIQCSEFDSTLRVFNGWCSRRQGVQSVSVVNANRNDRQWNVNVNRLDNDYEWNTENRFFFRNYAFSPKDFCPEGFLFCKYSLQPKSILPVSTRVLDIRIYFLSSIILHSHITERKNFARSFWPIDSITNPIFFSPELYEALNTRSRVLSKSLSTLVPIVCL